jgi:hypothetical protein
MPKTTIVDRYGRRLDPDEIEEVPDGGVVRVPMPFMDALSARTNRAFMRDSMNKKLVLDLLGAPAGHRPGYVAAADDWDDLGEAARQRYIQRLSEAWKGMAYAKQHKPSPGLPSADSEDAYERATRRALATRGASLR